MITLTNVNCHHSMTSLKCVTQTMLTDADDGCDVSSLSRIWTAFSTIGTNLSPIFKRTIVLSTCDRFKASRWQGVHLWTIWNQASQMKSKNHFNIEFRTQKNQTFECWYFRSLFFRASIFCRSYRSFHSLLGQPVFPIVAASTQPPLILRPLRINPSAEVDVVVHLEWVQDLENRSG